MTETNAPTEAVPAPAILRWVDEPPTRVRRGRPGRYTEILAQVRAVGSVQWAEIESGYRPDQASNQASQLRAKPENQDLEFSQSNGKIYVRVKPTQDEVQGETEAA